MPLTAISFQSSLHCFTGLPSPPPFHRNLGLHPSIPSRTSRVLLCCKKLQVSEPKHYANSFNFSNESVAVPKFRSANAKDIDVATLGNLCVDIVLNVPSLPPENDDERQAYMERLSSSPPDKVCFCWCCSPSSSCFLSACKRCPINVIISIRCCLCGWGF